MTPQQVTQQQLGTIISTLEELQQQIDTLTQRMERLGLITHGIATHVHCKACDHTITTSDSHREEADGFYHTYCSRRTAP